MSHIAGDIKWPDQALIRNYNGRNRTIRTIRTIFYNTGLIFTIFYLIASTVVQPLLEVQVFQRLELSAQTLLGVRRLMSKLLKRLKSTDSSVIQLATGDSKYIERSVQTDHVPSDDYCYRDSMEEEYSTASTWQSIGSKLASVKETVDRFNTNCARPSTNIENLTFQAKLVIDQLELSDNTEKIHLMTKESIDSIREMKGWYVNGLIPYN
ncbi:Peroxisomal membrane protein PEX17 [Nakaseomyces bracarensis]|uniref:Peroxisomal membrane protein PEX17 n=1 Tax=Nakaseomyces bracarensis TaxID=273131 RepID=A0ABR4NNF4_9SACH